MASYTRMDLGFVAALSIVVAASVFFAALVHVSVRIDGIGHDGLSRGPPTDATFLTARPPIRIDGDVDFTSANGVTGGSGTPSDPYIIEGWGINASSAAGIEIRNTTASFTVRSVSLHVGDWGSPYYPGVRLYNVSNGQIENATTRAGLVGSRWAFDAWKVSNLTLTTSWFDNASARLQELSNVTIRGNTAGYVYVYGSDNLTISDNRGIALTLDNTRRTDVSGNLLSRRMDLNGTYDTRITNNTLQGAGGDIGIAVYGGPARRVLVSGNQVSGFGWGIAAYGEDMMITGNDVERNNAGSGAGIWAGYGIGTYGGNVTVVGNNLANNGIGLWVNGRWASVRTHHNNFLQNAEQVNVTEGSNKSWDDGYPSGGNFWSDYAGVDNCKGPLQDDCTGGDGIGDAPYPVSATEEDRYPLMQFIGSDTVSPEMSITSPANGSTFTVDSILVTGTASDLGGSGLDRVEFRVYSDPWATANGTSAWSFPATLATGTNLIEARAWDGAGNPSSIASVTVTYAPPPPPPNRAPYYVNFSWSPGIGNTSGPVTFTARVADYDDPPETLQVRWDWETDGAWDTPWSLNKTAQYLFTTPGTYNVTLTAMDPGGLIGPNRTYPVRVDLPPPPPPPALAVEITATPTSGTMPLTVSFMSQITGGVAPFQYRWTLGDGSTSPAADTVHIYVTGGNFTVWLEVDDSARQWALSNFLWVNVTSAAVNLTVVPPSDFVETRDGVNATLRAVVWGGTPPYTYRWDFGDGMQGTGPEPVHTYPGPGTYDVTLTVTDSRGETASYSMRLTIPSRATPPTPTADWTGAWVGAAAAIAFVVGVGAHTLWMRRRQRWPPSP